MEPEEPTLRCRFCGGDPFEPDHDRRCDGKQGKAEAAAEQTAQVITIPRVRDTSIDAFYNAIRLGQIETRRQEVWAALESLGKATSTEVSEALKTFTRVSELRRLGIVRENIHARLSELRNLGLVRELGERECRITKRRCIEWAVIPDDEFIGVSVERRCALCGQITGRDVLIAV